MRDWGVVNSVLKSTFEGPYYLVGTLLFVGGLVSVLLWWLSAQREDRQKASALVEWFLEQDEVLLAARATIVESLPRDSQSLLARNRFDAVDFLKLCHARHVNPASLADLDLSEHKESRQAVFVLTTFALKVQRSPLDRRTAFRYAAASYCRWVEIWIPAIARYRQEDPGFFEDGLELYRTWRRELDRLADRVARLS